MSVSDPSDLCMNMNIPSERFRTSKEEGKTKDRSEPKSHFLWESGVSRPRTNARSTFRPSYLSTFSPYSASSLLPSFSCFPTPPPTRTLSLSLSFPESSSPADLAIVLCMPHLEWANEGVIWCDLFRSISSAYPLLICQKCKSSVDFLNPLSEPNENTRQSRHPVPVNSYAYKYER